MASWLASAHSACSTPLHLVCLETGPAQPLPPFRSGGALAFVTSASGAGDLSSWAQAGGDEGLEAGDTTCQNLALAAGLPAPTTFNAWLSTSEADAIDRFSYDGSWIRPDGGRIASSKADLTDEYLLAPVNVDESGNYNCQLRGLDRNKLRRKSYRRALRWLGFVFRQRLWSLWLREPGATVLDLLQRRRVRSHYASDLLFLRLPGRDFRRRFRVGGRDCLVDERVRALTPEEVTAV